MSERRLDHAPSDTAEVNAAQRAAEMRLPERRRLLSDAYAHHFVANPRYRLLFATTATTRVVLRVFDRMFPGLQALILLRARFASDAIVRAQGEGIDQVVLLGAGYDSTAFRLPEPAIDLYEIDAPPTQAAKRLLIERKELASRHRLTLVPCDFEKGSFVPGLLGAGFDAQRPSLFIWLGVTFYLSLDAFLAALEDIAVCSASGSRLVLDYMDPAVVSEAIENPGVLRMARAAARRGEPYQLGWELGALDRMLRLAGFEIFRHCRIPDLAACYGPEDGVWCRTDDWMGVLEAHRRRQPRTRSEPAAPLYKLVLK
jgi:methyltransferase (TIGR00027 family)